MGTPRQMAHSEHFTGATQRIMANPSRRQPHSSHFRDSLWVFIAGLGLLYLVFTIRVARDPAIVISGNSGDPYNTLARSLVAGEGFSHLIFGLRPPLPPLLVAGVYALAGYQPTIAVFFHVVLGALTAALTYKTGWVLLRHRGAALLGALLLATETAHLDTNAMMYSESMHSATLMICLYWLARLLRREQWRAAIGVGIGAGGALLSRPISSNFPIALALLLVLYPPVLRRWRYALAALAIAGSAYGAWATRNFVYVDNFSISSTGAFTLLFYKTVAVEHNATGRDPHEIAVEVKLELYRRIDTDHRLLCGARGGCGGGPVCDPLPDPLYADGDPLCGAGHSPGEAHH